MRIVIITEGGQDKGFGHIVRSKALYQAFEERGLDVQMVINGDDSINSLIEGMNYNTFDWLNHEEKLFNFIDGSDIVIIDSYSVFLVSTQFRKIFMFASSK